MKNNMPFIPNDRERQMIEAIADTLIHANAQTHSELSLMDSVARNLRSLARGGGEKLECTCNIQYISCDVHEKPQITFSSAQVNEKRDEEIADMFKSGGKLEYVEDKPKREMPKMGETYLCISSSSSEDPFELSEYEWTNHDTDIDRWKNGRAFLLSERALAEKKVAELNEILRR